MPWEFILQYVIGPVVGFLGAKYLGQQQWNKVRDGAAKIIGDPADPITDSRKAMEKAIIEHNFRQVESGVRELERLQAEGKLEARAAAERGKRNAEMIEVEVLPPDE